MYLQEKSMKVGGLKQGYNEGFEDQSSFNWVFNRIHFLVLLSFPHVDFVVKWGIEEEGFGKGIDGVIWGTVGIKFIFEQFYPMCFQRSKDV